MELKSNQPMSKMIDCAALNGASYSTAQSWNFKELYTYDIEPECFDNMDSCMVHEYADVLAWSLQLLSVSSSARLMIQEACQHNWSIIIDDLRGGDYCLDVENKTITLDNNALSPAALARSVYFRNVTLITLIKALRDIWQEKRHGGFDELYSPDHVLFMERIRAADLDVLAVLTAWELRAENYNDLWRHIIGSDLGDMAMTFSGYLERDPTAQFNGKALAAAFRQWFQECGRINACDHDTLEYMDDVMMCTDIQNPFGRKKPMKMNVEVLSCLPDRTAYLQGMGAEILSNPIFSSVDDEINQTHLFHILYDMEAVIVEDVPFRDAELARKIFPVE